MFVEITAIFGIASIYHYSSLLEIYFYLWITLFGKTTRNKNSLNLC